MNSKSLCVFIWELGVGPPKSQRAETNNILVPLCSTIFPFGAWKSWKKKERKGHCSFKRHNCLGSRAALNRNSKLSKNLLVAASRYQLPTAKIIKCSSWLCTSDRAVSCTWLSQSLEPTIRTAGRSKPLGISKTHAIKKDERYIGKGVQIEKKRKTTS